MKTINLLAIAILIILSSCSSPLDKTYNEATVKEDVTSLKEVLDSNDINLMAGSMFRLTLQSKDLSLMTYGEILEDGKIWKLEQERQEAEAKALAEEAARIEAERIEKLSNAVMVTVFEKGFTKYNYDSYITMKFVIKNKSDKNIRAIKGSVIFSNLFDEKIKELNFVYDQPVTTGETINWDATMDYNQFKDSDKTLKNKDLKDLKVTWSPEKIIFEDGTTLE